MVLLFWLQLLRLELAVHRAACWLRVAVTRFGSLETCVRARTSNYKGSRSPTDLHFFQTSPTPLELTTCDQHENKVVDRQISVAREASSYLLMSASMSASTPTLSPVEALEISSTAGNNFT